MNFLWQAAAWGLLTLPIILLLHVLRNRRQQLSISNLQLWWGLQQKKQGSLPRSIPLSLLLMLQLLIATGLTMALAQPVFSFLLDQPRHLIFILDMTTSMTAQADTLAGSPTRRFDLAKQSIQEQIQSLTGQDTFTLIGLKARPEILLAGSGQEKAHSLAAVENLVPGATGLDLPAALNLTNGLIDSSRQNQIVILTDGAYHLDPTALPQVSAPVEWVSLPSPTPTLSNQALLNVSARTLPDGRHRLFGRVINYSDAAVSRTLQVFADEQTFATVTVQLEPQGEVARVWTLPAATEIASLELVEPDVLPLDNRAELLLTEVTRSKVLLISDTPDILSRALAAQPGVELTAESASTPTPNLADFDLVVYEGAALPLDLTSWPAGNVWVVNPPLGHPLLPAQNFSRNLRPDPASASALLAGVDLSGVYFNRALQLTLPTWATVDLAAAASTENSGESAVPKGQALLFHGVSANSRIAVWAFDLAASNLPARLALPLLTASTLQMLLSPAPQAVVPAGEPVVINGNFQVEVPGSGRLSPPLAQPGWGGEFTHTQQPGLYKVYNSQNELVAGFAVQAGSALESNLAVQFQPQGINLARSTSHVLPPKIDYYDLWPWLAGLVLAVVMLEGWLAWRR